MNQLSHIAKSIAAMILISAFSGCGSTSENSLFVRAGDPFFDEAVSRLSISDKKNLGVERNDQLHGFFFKGEKENCIVLLPLNKKLILHGTNIGYCYNNITNKFMRKI